MDFLFPLEGFTKVWLNWKIFRISRYSRFARKTCQGSFVFSIIYRFAISIEKGYGLIDGRISSLWRICVPFSRLSFQADKNRIDCSCCLNNKLVTYSSYAISFFTYICKRLLLVFNTWNEEDTSWSCKSIVFVLIIKTILIKIELISLLNDELVLHE